MPFPVLVWVAIAGIAVLCAAALKWDDIVILLKGKQLVVLGARGVGKTHLVKFLTTGTLPAEYKQTIAPEKTGSRWYSLRDLDLKIKETLDLSGSTDAHAQWKEQIDKADVVFYLLRADRLIAGDVDVEERVRNDLRHIGGWLEDRELRSKERNARPHFLIIGTHCDLDAEFRTVSNDKYGDYVDKFCRLPIVSELLARAGGTQKAKVVLGSMKTREDTEALVYQVLQQVVS